MSKNNSFVQKTRESLLERRKELILQANAVSSADNNQGGVKDTGEEATEVVLNLMNQSLNATLNDEVKLIDEALDRVATGNYGVCKDCEGKISEKRLEVFPYALRCIVCQEAQEN